MTPGARVQAAIEVVSEVLEGAPAERVLTRWARNSRFAGSKDRAAVRDHVFDALRQLRSAAWIGGRGGETLGPADAVGVLWGMLRANGIDTERLFDGVGHAPQPYTPGESVPRDLADAPEAVRLDLPDWLLTRLTADHGEGARQIAAALRGRAPVTLRANRARMSGADLVETLRAEGQEAEAVTGVDGAIRLPGAPRGLTNLDSFEDGLWELQDAGSQALVNRLPVEAGARILDLCAGGGGKALAYAARGGGPVVAHDADPGRMRDLPTRAARAGVRIETTRDPESAGPFAGIIADAPCSGSGSWRRAPDAKWRLMPDRLDDLRATQDGILDRAMGLVQPGGWVAYMTCSVLREENEARTDAAVARDPRFAEEDRWSCWPEDGGQDGFYLSLLRHCR